VELALVAKLERQIKGLDRELANLSETAARGGAVPAVLDALASREAERRRLAAESAAQTRSSQERLLSPAELRARLRSYLSDWELRLNDDAQAASGALDRVLSDRIRIEPDRGIAGISSRCRCISIACWPPSCRIERLTRRARWLRRT
jgi:hypothetical protein